MSSGSTRWIELLYSKRALMMPSAYSASVQVQGPLHGALGMRMIVLGEGLRLRGAARVLARGCAVSGIRLAGAAASVVFVGNSQAHPAMPLAIPRKVSTVTR